MQLGVGPLQGASAMLFIPTLLVPGAVPADERKGEERCSQRYTSNEIRRYQTVRPATAYQVLFLLLRRGWPGIWIAIIQHTTPPPTEGSFYFCNDLCGNRTEEAYHHLKANNVISHYIPRKTHYTSYLVL